jgi:hypothetical protein
MRKGEEKLTKQKKITKEKEKKDVLEGGRRRRGLSQLEQTAIILVDPDTPRQRQLDQNATILANLDTPRQHKSFTMRPKKEILFPN